MTAQPTSDPLPGLRPGLRDELLRVEALEKVFTRSRIRLLRHQADDLRAVDGVSVDIARGETLGLVGESGCGKSTIARCVLRLTEPSGGRVIFDGQDITALSRPELQPIRRRMQMIFQDPSASLDPRMSVKALVEEPLRIHRIGNRSDRVERVSEILDVVGISSSGSGRKPHEFSGGQRQRIALARALILNPDLVILDEPVTALDVSIQAQVLNLLRALQERLKLTYMFIVHDLAVAEHFCDRIAVLYLGTIVELTDRETLFRRPLHPYTTALLSASPVPDPSDRRRRSRIVLKGEVNAHGPRPPGCVFRPRCPVGRDREICRLEMPRLAELGTGHWVACHFPGELAAERRE